MKSSKLYMSHWLKANGRERTQPTDNWYLDFAKEMFRIVEQSPLFAHTSVGTPAEAALKTSLYFQDAIAQTGGWKTFTGKCNTLYGKPLPFYDCADYIADEINLTDVCFLLWSCLSHPEGHIPFNIHNPYDETLLTLARLLYEQMDNRFEEAPISEKSSPDAWVMDTASLDIPSTDLPEVTPHSRLTKDVERCLEHSGGYPLLYFATYQTLHTFLTEVLEWEDHPDGLLSDLKEEKDFVIYANAKGMLMAPGVASCFCDARNPAYNAQVAASEGYKLFCLPGHCPFDLLKYGMNHGLFPDAALPFAGGKELLQHNWDFITRYFLGEYYEGE